jgi:hypothetical protein
LMEPLSLILCPIFFASLMFSIVMLPSHQRVSTHSIFLKMSNDIELAQTTYSNDRQGEGTIGMWHLFSLVKSWSLIGTSNSIEVCSKNWFNKRAMKVATKFLYNN